MALYLRGNDSIFIQEALQTLAAQPELLACEAIQKAVVVAAQKDEVSLILAVFEELLRLQWTPERIQKELREQFAKEAISELLEDEMLLFYEALTLCSDPDSY